jgi:hypothetical protein
LYILFFILWQFELCDIFFFSFYDSSNGVVYLVFHFMTVRTVCYILFFNILPFRKSYYILVLANFHFMLKSNQDYSFCIAFRPSPLLGIERYWFNHILIKIQNVIFTETKQLTNKKLKQLSPPTSSASQRKKNVSKS